MSILLEEKAKLINGMPPIEILKRIEYAGRNCYASQDKITDDSYERFIKNLIKNHHEAPLEFGDITMELVTSRAVMAELTRHRLASFCIESQRYIQEAKSGDIAFIKPVWFKPSNYDMSAIWYDHVKYTEAAYKKLIEKGAKPEEAREVLSNSVACKIMIKANIREWRHIFSLRLDKAAYPQMRELMGLIKEQLKEFPIVFDDLKGEENNE